MKKNYTICIVIPCYNEAAFFLQDDYLNFIQNNEDSLLCFVNDGSSDNTLEILKELKNNFPNQVEVVSYKKNKGKAHAVREGFLFCNTNFDFNFIAYLDADLAVSLEECYSMINQLSDNKFFAFGSRIQRIGSTIERKKSRFLIGRVIATVISSMLDIKVYDTQCGCKIFEKELSKKVFEKSFISKWLFDVEIFFRILQLFGKEKALKGMIEVPLIRWIDRGDSKVKLSYFYKLWIDLYTINRFYKKKNSK